MNRSLLSLFFASVSLLSACAAEDVRVGRGCVTACDLAHQRCLASAANLCNTCLNAAIELGISCASQCGGDRCTGSCPATGACVDRPWKVTANNPDPAVRAACDRARQQLGTCGRRDELTDCEKASRFERPETVPVYECIAATPCSDSHAHCAASLTVGTLGDELQARAQSCSWQGFTPEQVRANNAWEGWLRPSAARAARDCLAQPECSDAMACLNALDASAL